MKIYLFIIIIIILVCLFSVITTGWWFIQFFGASHKSINPSSLSKTPDLCVRCAQWRTKKTQLRNSRINLSARSARQTHQSTSAQVALYALVASHASRLTSNALVVRARGTRPSSFRSHSSMIISSSLVLFFLVDSETLLAGFEAKLVFNVGRLSYGWESFCFEILISISISLPCFTFFKLVLPREFRDPFGWFRVLYF